PLLATRYARRSPHGARFFGRSATPRCLSVDRSVCRRAQDSPRAKIFPGIEDQSAGALVAFFPTAEGRRSMRIVRTIEELRQAFTPLRSRAPIGFVPTMGAWHDGHVALIRAALRDGCIVVASIFVNPAQFNDPRDLAAYPRDEVRDARMAAAEGVDVLFIPTVDEIYPPGFATRVDVEGAACGLEGELRPGHFGGVATVCLKLFPIVDPAVAFFGQKDAQQVTVIEQLVRDLNLPLAIRIVPTVRDHDGLALSSRNVRLSPDERRRVLAIPSALAAGVA